MLRASEAEIRVNFEYVNNQFRLGSAIRRLMTNYPTQTNID